MPYQVNRKIISIGTRTGTHNYFQSQLYLYPTHHPLSTDLIHHYNTPSPLDTTNMPPRPYISPEKRKEEDKENKPHFLKNGQGDFFSRYMI
jgi:hypothetical protein